MNVPPQIRPRAVTIVSPGGLTIPATSGWPGHLASIRLRPDRPSSATAPGAAARNPALDIDVNDKVLGQPSAGDRDEDSGGGPSSRRECPGASALLKRPA